MLGAEVVLIACLLVGLCYMYMTGKPVNAKSNNLNGLTLIPHAIFNEALQKCVEKRGFIHVVCAPSFFGKTSLIQKCMGEYMQGVCNAECAYVSGLNAKVDSDNAVQWLDQQLKVLDCI